MKKTLLYLLIFSKSSLCAGNTTQDTIDHPYWQEMMKKPWSQINIKQVKRAYDLYFSNKPKTRGAGWKIFERWYENKSHIAHRDGTLPNPNNTEKELKQFKQRNLLPRGSQTGNWRSIGPNKMPVNGFWAGGPQAGTAWSGRINTIFFHPLDSNRFWVGTPQGGLWSTVDGGKSWNSNTDQLPSLGVSTGIAFIDSNKIIIGTGDRDGGDASGRGIMISRDNGTTWTQISQLNTRVINKIVVNPLNKLSLLVATDSGVYRSYDQGNTFNMVQNGVNYLNQPILDIHYKLNDSNIAVATMNKLFSPSQSCIYLISGSSYDSILVNTDNSTRGIVSTSHSNQENMYVLFAKSKSISSVYKLRFSGTNISPTMMLDDTTFNILGYNKDGSDKDAGQGFYDISMYVNPLDSNKIYVGGINIYESANAGTNWVCKAFWSDDTAGGVLPLVHADHHYMTYNPLNSTYYLGNDGGIYSTKDFINFYALNEGLAISQFYDIDVSTADSGVVVGGLQDNASMIMKNGQWKVNIGGDGMVSEINDIDPNLIVGSSQNGSIELSRNAYNSNTTRIGNGSGSGIDEAGPWVTYHEMSPFNTKLHLVGTLTKMFYSRNLNDTNLLNYDSIPGIAGNEFTTIRFSRKDSAYAIAGDVDGSFYVIANLINGTPSFVKKNGPVANTKIADVEFDHKTINKIYAISDKNVYTSLDTGNSWVNITSNLPNVAIYTLLNDKNTDGGIYVGTEVGVFYKDNTMVNWILFSQNLPANSQIRDMEIWYDTLCSSNSKIVLGTYGRSAWAGDVYQNITTSLSPNFSNPPSAYKDQIIQFTNTTANAGTNPNYLWIISPSTFIFANGTNNASASPSILFQAVGKYTITLLAKNAITGEYCRIKKDTVINVILNPNKVVIDKPSSVVICQGDTLQITASNSGSYSWSPNSSISNSIGSVVKVYPNTSTTYKVLGSANDSAEIIVSVTPKPVITLSPPTASILAGNSVSVTASGADTYTWSPALGLNMTNGPTIIANPQSTITYIVEGVKNNCKASASILVTISPSLSIQNQSIEELEVYPIPTSKWLYIKVSSPIHYYILSLDGRMLSTQHIAGDARINLDHLPTGDYFLECSDNTGRKKIFKISIIK